MNTRALFLVLGASSALSAAELAIVPEDAVIVVPENLNPVVTVAAREYQRHIEMMTRRTLPIVKEPVQGKYSFVFGTPEGVALKTEEARWEVTPQMTRIYGDSTPVGKATDERVWTSRSKSGDLYAVYDFLEKQLGFLFLAPGPDGTAFEPAQTINLKTGASSWDPGTLVLRELRPECARWTLKAYMKSDKMPPDFKLTEAQFLQRNKDCLVWLKQQRMGSSASFNCAHAFTQWWNKYGATHPEYFALYNGKRYPVRPNRPDTIKMCPSCKGLHQQIVKDWLATPNHNHYINICENDWGDYCQCEECRKLDMPQAPGAPWDEDLTDRYIFFANAVLAEARKHDPQAVVCFYAYANYRFPPRKQRVADGVLLGFVPSMLGIEKVAGMYKGWRSMGATLMFQRPNDHHINCGLPMGFEKQLFDHFQVGIQNNILGTDYDTIHGFWETTGVADYILARAHIDPSQTFEHWMDEYCSAFGAAAQDVKDYYAYWRANVWESRLVPNTKAILERGRYGNFRRGLMTDLAKYYSADDFRKTDDIIRTGLAKDLTVNQRKRLETLRLANIHNRLAYEAIVAKGDAKCAAGVALLDFRRKNRERLNMNWSKLFELEKEFGDITGIGMAQRIGDYKVGKRLPERFYFMPDCESLGGSEHWEATPFEKYSRIWYQLSTEHAWEAQPRYEPESLGKLLKTYDGVGYYAQAFQVPASWKGKEIALLFGAVDESAWIYVNGTLCGEHLYKGGDEWQEPFSIRIDQAIDWNAPTQSVVVKVEDKAGAGGIWRPVTMVMR